MRFHRNKVVEIIYIDRFGELSQRYIRVIASKEDRLIAYCYTKKKVRVFLLENILGTKRVA